MNKIIIIAIIIVTMSAIVILPNLSEDNSDDVMVTLPTGDVIMPTKVSRPGCEQTNSCYIPSEISISLGDTVTWVNEDAAFHSVTSGTYDNPTSFFDSGHLNPGQSFAVVFYDAGKFDYFCTLHPWMSGLVIVK